MNPMSSGEPLGREGVTAETPKRRGVARPPLRAALVRGGSTPSDGPHAQRGCPPCPAPLDGEVFVTRRRVVRGEGEHSRHSSEEGRNNLTHRGRYLPRRPPQRNGTVLRWSDTRCQKSLASQRGGRLSIGTKTEHVNHYRITVRRTRIGGGVMTLPWICIAPNVPGMVLRGQIVKALDPDDTFY